METANNQPDKIAQGQPHRIQQWLTQQQMQQLHDQLDRKAQATEFYKLFE
jgi:hypothetical protein